MRCAATRIGAAFAFSALATLTGCGEPKPPAPAEPAPVTTPVEEAEAPLPPSELETQLPPAVLEGVLKAFTGDLDAMVKRRVVRIGVTFNRTFYFVDRGVQRGVSYEYGQLVEERLNKHFKTKAADKIHVVFVPLPREMLLSALVEGRVDLVAAQVTVRPELEKHVDFTNATRTNVRQVVVTGPGAPAIASVDDLSGKEVFVREKSAYHQSLLALNETFVAGGKPPIAIQAAPPSLEDDDLLEMVNAGLIPAIVVDDYLANFWKKVLPEIAVHENVAVHSGGKLAIAIRKNSPQLASALNKFMGNYGLGTSFGNQIERRYLVETRYAKNATSEASRKKFQQVVDLFRKYSDRYDMDFLLMAAQAYQESQLDHAARSRVGAIGIMQVMPATGRELKVGDIRQLEPNIHAGVKYVRKTIDTYFKDEPMDALNKGLFAFASYNAGPNRVRQLRELAAKRGLDPNVWFGNVEQIASERIGRETVTYVANIYKYY
ncbi:MAG TPA: transporter substrate-binding domain-containing protein, partial [Candidatus Polarisedimenticolaceae bacterium]